MNKDDFVFSKEDLQEIFGGKIELDEKKLEKQALEEIKEVSKSIVINKSKYEEIKIYDTKVDMKEGKLIKESSLNNESLTFVDFLNEKIICEIFKLNDELREIIEKELINFIPKKSVLNMLLRTLEKTAINFLILRNTNFNIDGRLKENGSIDITRLLQNIEKYKTQIMEIDKEIENALKTLFNMRMNAIKAGLGEKSYAAIKENILKKFNIVKAGYSNAVFNFFKNKIFEEIFNIKASK